MDPALAQELGSALGMIDRFSDAAKLKSELEAARFCNVDVAEHVIEFVFADKQAWWDFNWSHGSRMYLEALPEDARNRFTSEIEDAMEQIRDERGFPRIYTALFSRADV
jgi:hypothetical protein